MRAIAAVTTPGETAALCHSVGLARASFYRRRRPTPSLPPPPSRAPSPRALAADERQAMLDTLHGFGIRKRRWSSCKALRRFSSRTPEIPCSSSCDTAAPAAVAAKRTFFAAGPSGLSYLTPADVHYGRAATVLAVRHRTRLAAYAAHPERFVQGPPRPETLPTAAWINRPPKPTREDAPGATIVTPDDPQHGVISRSQPISADRSITLVASRGSLQ